MDVCQTVLKSFFVRTAAGQYDLDYLSELVRLLVSMARNKLASEARNQHRQKLADHRRTAGDEAALQAAPAGEASPSRVAAGRDLLAAVRQRLTDEERVLATCAARGTPGRRSRSERVEPPRACRVQFARALDRVACDLDIEGGAG